MKTIITIGREYGSGGREIAKRLAETLSIPFYDKELISKTAEQTGLSEDYIRGMEEKKTNSFLYNIYFSTGNLPVTDQVFFAQSQVIRDAASQGACVIVGRCADYVLKNRDNCLHVFIHAPQELREEKAAAEFQLDAAHARSWVNKQDKTRSSYYNHFTDQRWGDCRNYHLTLDASLGQETALGLLLELYKRKEAGL